MVAVTIGTGTFTYDIVDDWAKLPQGWALGQAEPAVDRDDRVYVFNRSEHPLVVLDREGNFITEWGQGVLTDAHGIFISGDDYIYLPVREAHAVVKYHGTVGQTVRHRGDTARRHRAAGRWPLQPVHRHRAVSLRGPVHIRRLR